MPTKQTNARLPSGEVLSQDYDPVEADGTLSRRERVEPLGLPSVSRTLAAGAASASVALTATVQRISLVALTADVAFRVGLGAQTAVATDHYLSVGERVEVRVLPGSTIAAIRAGTVDATLRISELI